MGFGVPGGVASGLVDRHRMAIVFVGDGGILMTGQELATAMQYGAKPKIVISDNGSYGTIRQHQEKHFPKRVSGTLIQESRFLAMGEILRRTCGQAGTRRRRYGEDPRSVEP